MSEITDHKTDGMAVSKDDGFEVMWNGQQRPRHTMRDWKLVLIQWKDGSMSWVPVKDMKESPHPIEVVEYTNLPLLGGRKRFYADVTI
jgi:hypothetical protein